jgi:hypothetical protein
MHKYKLEDSKEKLWRGAILGTIAHAIFVTHYPELASSHSWDGINYNVQNYAGAFGTVTFSDQGTVAVFFDAHSTKSPVRVGKGYEPHSFFTGIPAALFAVAQAETLQYALQVYDGVERPVITAAFWSEGEDLVAAAPWSEVIENGAHLVRIQLLEIDAAIEEWQSEYELLPAQVELARSLLHQKVSDPNTPIRLNKEEQSVIINTVATGVAESRELFESVGVILPES